MDLIRWGWVSVPVRLRPLIWIIGVMWLIWMIGNFGFRLLRQLDYMLGYVKPAKTDPAVRLNNEMIGRLHRRYEADKKKAKEENSMRNEKEGEIRSSK